MSAKSSSDRTDHNGRFPTKRSYHPTSLSPSNLTGSQIKNRPRLPTISRARASADGQTLETQLSQLRAAGAEKIFREKVSGARADRVQLRKAIAALDPRDVLLVTRLDRLARSTQDLLNILDEIAKKRAGFRSLSDTWADTTTPHGRLMLTVLGGLAEFERDLIRVRTGEGREREGQGRKAGAEAKAHGSPAAGGPCPS
jgi:DNA invertase Pin-like site-specific DNA recombinase